MEYLFDELKGALINASRLCKERLVSLDSMVNNIILWNYSSANTIEKIFDELLEIGMFCDIELTYFKLLNYFKNIDYEGYEFYKNEYVNQYKSCSEKELTL